MKFGRNFRTPNVYRLVWLVTAVLLLSPLAARAQELTADEVRFAVTQAADAAGRNAFAIAVVDRAGNPLAVFRRLAGASIDGASISDPDVEKALSLARTGAFFSNFGTPLSSRTVRAISRPNFPEGIPNQPAGALFGIENTNRGCDFNIQYLPGQAFPRLLNAAGSGYSLGITTVPGGIPLFRNGVTVVGGIGVSGLQSDAANEFAALAGAQGAGFFVRLPLPDPGAVYVDGFRLPFVDPSPPTQFSFSASETFLLGPVDGSPAPEGWLAGPIAGQELSAVDVASIVANAINTANRTRAQIRLPLGSRARMVISVADLDGSILALYRMADSTIFSIDAALTKARNVAYFSSGDRDARDLIGVPAGTAVTNRTIGFGSQPLFPSGIFFTNPGPFADLLAFDTANPCTQGHQPINANQSGVVFFPGSAPLYRNGRLVGGLGISGDGVEQDDYVAAGGAAGYEAPASIRADQVFIRTVRLPYWKFPRNPEK
jgi:uncharacterized protein GlcG (DUF336 family)